jgi:hypothetical protein
MFIKLTEGGAALAGVLLVTVAEGIFGTDADAGIEDPRGPTERGDGVVLIPAELKLPCPRLSVLLVFPVSLLDSLRSEGPASFEGRVRTVVTFLGNDKLEDRAGGFSVPLTNDLSAAELTLSSSFFPSF